MFCYKCGKQIEDDSKFCPFCGAPMDEASLSVPKKEEKPKKAKEEPKVEAKIEEPKKQEETITQTQPIYTNPNAGVNNNKKMGIIFGCIAGAVALVIAAYLVLSGGKSVKALDGMGLEFTGYNGYGEPNILYSPDMDAYDILDNELELMEEQYYATCSLMAVSSNCLKLQEKAYFLEEALDSMDYTYEVSGGKPSDQLSNGDTVTLKVVYNKDFLKRAGYKLSNTSKKFKVEGLPEPEEVDLIQYVEPKWLSNGGEFYLGVSVSGDSPLEDIPCNISEPDASGNVTVTIIDTEVGKYGYKPLAGNNSKTAYVGQKPQVISHLDDSNRDQISNLVLNVLREVHINKCGWNLYTNKGDELVLGLQTSDITSLSVSNGTIRASVNVNTDKGNTYKKSIVFEAYIDQDGNYVYSTQFDTDSLGCGVRGSQWPDHE